MKKWIFALALLPLLNSCKGPSGDKSPAEAAASSSVVYFNGDIITMEGDSAQYVEALVEKDGVIAFLGKKDEAIAFAGKDARQVDLQGRTMTPGFVDAHGHLIYTSKNALDASLGGCKDIAELQERMRAFAKEVPEGGWLVGFGYSATALKEGRHPTVEELDQISTTLPVYVKDGSGHHGAINSVLMKMLNISAATPDPDGGFYERKPGSKELAGHVAEEAHFQIGAKRPAFSDEMIRKGLDKAVQIWVENGHTTAQETGLGLGADDFETVQLAIDNKWLPIDLVLFVKGSVASKAATAAYNVKQKYGEPGSDDAKKLLAARPDMNARYYNRIRLGGIKFWMDGSPETMLVSEPFTKLPAGVTDKNYKGIQTTPTAELDSAFAKYWKSDLQIAVHEIGDQAMEVCLQAIEKAIKSQGMSDHRPILQHANFTRPDQIARIKAVGGIPSFTMAGLEAKGDDVAILVGPKRVSWAVPANSMQKAGIRWTSHTDWPAGGSPSEIVGMSGAVNRRTVTGNVINPAECVTPYQALQAITYNAAYQLKEEKSKGSLKVGKLADLVILDKNPLKVDPLRIQDVRVMQTIKEGKTVYERKADGVAATDPSKEYSSEDPHTHLQTDRPLTKRQEKTLVMLMDRQK